MSTTISAIYRESVSTVGPGELAVSSAEKSDSDLYKVCVAATPSPYALSVAHAPSFSLPFCVGQILSATSGDSNVKGGTERSSGDSSVGGSSSGAPAGKKKGSAQADDEEDEDEAEYSLDDFEGDAPAAAAAAAPAAAPAPAKPPTVPKPAAAAAASSSSADEGDGKAASDAGAESIEMIKVRE